MSSVSTYSLTSPVSLSIAAVSVVAGGAGVIAGAAVAGWEQLQQAAAELVRWMDDIDARYARLLSVHRINVKHGLEGHLAAALRALGYVPVAPAAQAGVVWTDHEGRKHRVHEIWKGRRGLLGFSRLNDGGIQAYCRTEEVRADLHEAMTQYAQKVMAAHFQEAEPRTFHVPTDDGDKLPTRLTFRTGKGLRLLTAVQNPERDERCLGPAARVDRLFGEPLERSRVILRKTQTSRVSQKATAANRRPQSTTKPASIVIRRAR